MPELLRDELLAAGVRSEQVDVVPEEAAAVDHALRIAQPGDLLLIFGDNVTRGWKQIINFTPAPDVETAAKPKVVAPDPSDLPSFSEGDLLLQDLVRDERGVRLARNDD